MPDIIKIFVLRKFREAPAKKNHPVGSLYEAVTLSGHLGSVALADSPNNLHC